MSGSSTSYLDNIGKLPHPLEVFLKRDGNSLKVTQTKTGYRALTVSCLSLLPLWLGSSWLKTNWVVGN